jgi:uncharacterized membrane protein
MNALWTTTVVLFALVLALIGGLLFYLPRLTRPDLYFAVTVQSGFRDSPEGRAILSGYRMWIVVSSALAIALVMIEAAHWQLALVAGLVIQEAGSLTAYLSCRHRVLPHAVNPTAVREAALQSRSDRLPGGWKLQAGPFILLAIAALYLNRHWPQIPARFPVHWGLGGLPDGWTLRTAPGVYGPIVEGAVVCATMAGLTYALLRWSRRVRIAGNGAEAEHRFRRAVALILISTEYLIGVTFAGLSLLPLMPAPPPTALTVGLPLVFVAAVVVMLVRLGQGGSRSPEAAEEFSGVARPVGDRTADQYWKAGLFYVNPEDPALFIEKRFGIGYTMNFGRPASWIIIAAVALLPLIIGLVLKSAAK